MADEFNLRQLKQQAKDLLRALRNGDATATGRVGTAGYDPARFSLKDAQNIIARDNGFSSWRDLRSQRRGFDREATIGFLEAVRRRDIDALKASLEAEPDLVHLKLDYSLTNLKDEPFRAAVREGRLEGNEMLTALQLMALTQLRGEDDEERARMHRVLKLLLEYGADINAVGRMEGYHYAVAMACWEGHISTVELLLDHGADITGEAGREALFTSANHGRIEKLDLLAKYGAEVPPRTWIIAGEEDRLMEAIDHDPGLLNSVDDEGYTLLASVFEGWEPNFKIANALVERGATMDVFAAAGLDDVARLEKLYRSDRAQVNGRSPLWFAAKGNAVEAAELLCKKGAEPDEEVIQEAALHDRTALVKVLLNHGGVVTESVMSAAAWRNKDPELIRLLLAHGGDPDGMGSRFAPGFGPIHWLCWVGQEAGLRLLLEAGADPNLRSPAQTYNTPLHFATRHPNLVNLLLDAGADSDLANANHETPLEKARREGVEPSIRALSGYIGREYVGKAVSRFEGFLRSRQEQPGDYDETERQLIAAAMGSKPGEWDTEPDVKSMQRIVSATPEVLSRIGQPLLHVLLHSLGCAPSVKCLLDHGVRLEIDNSKYNVLFDIAYSWSCETLRVVFESGLADATGIAVKKPHAGWPDNTSMLYWAAYRGRPDVVKLLLEYGAGVHHELRIRGNGEQGCTSLQVASSPSPWSPEVDTSPKPWVIGKSTVGMRECARLLIEDGAYYDANSACGLGDAGRLKELLDRDHTIAKVSDDYGMTALHWAARSGSIDCVQVLLAAGADVNVFNAAQRTPIQLAAEADQPEAIRLLAANGADLDTQDKKGRTPLHRATYEGRVEAAEALLELRADPTIKNKKGKSAFEVARKGARYLKDRA